MRRLLACYVIVAAVVAVPLQARQADAAFEAARLAWEEGRPADALTHLDRSSPESRDEAKSLYLEALIHRALGDSDLAAQRIADAVDRDPDNLEYLELQLDLGIRTRFVLVRRSRHRALIRKILELDSLNVAAHNAAGYLALRHVLAHRDNYRFESPVHLNRPQVELYTRQRPTRIPDPKADPGKSELFMTLDVDRLRGYLDGTVYVGQEADGHFPIAVAHLHTVLDVDPGNTEAARYLATLYMVGRLDEFLESLVDFLRIHQSQSHWTEFIAGYLAQRQERYADAQQHFERAFYLAPDSLRHVYENPALVMSEEQRSRFADVGDQIASLPPDQAFWAFRDVRYLTAHNERWTEHIARVVYSELVFGSFEGEFSGLESDRGQIFVRYGLPPIDVFVRGSMFSCAGGSYAKFHVFDYESRRIIFGMPPIAKDNEYILYSPCAEAFRSTGILSMHADYVIRARELIREQPESYEYEPAGARVEMPYLVSRFGSDIVVAAGVQVPSRPTRGDLVMPLETGVFLIDPSSGVVVENRNSVALLKGERIRNLEDRFLWTFSSTIEADPGEYALSVEFETSESGAVAGYNRSELTLAAPDSGRVGLSDILLAYSVTDAASAEPAPGLLRRGDYDIDAAPVGAFARQAPLYIYFETYSKAVSTGEARFRVAVALAPRDNGGLLGQLLDRLRPGDQSEDGVSTAFEGSSPSPDDGHYLILDLRDEDPGDYVLAVRVTDLVTGQSAESTRPVRLY